MRVQGVDAFRGPPQLGSARPRQNRLDDLFAEDQQGGQCADAEGLGVVAARRPHALDQRLPAEFAQIIGRLTGVEGGAPGPRWPWVFSASWATVKPPGLAAKASTAAIISTGRRACCGAKIRAPDGPRSGLGYWRVFWRLLSNLPRPSSTMRVDGVSSWCASTTSRLVID